MSESSEQNTQLFDTLTTDPFGKTPIAQPDTASSPSSLPHQQLTPEQTLKAKDIAKQLDPKKQADITQYGAQAQQSLAHFSQSMLDHVQSQQTGEVGSALTDLMYRLNEANPKELEAGNNNVFRKLFGKMKKSVFEMTTKYQKIGAQIDNIADRLDHEKNDLLTDNSTLDNLYYQNKAYFDSLNVFIAAGQMKLQELTTVEIPHRLAQAQADGDQMALQEVNDLKNYAQRLEKRVYDLQLARQITIQQAPQIRMIQNTNQALADKIQASITTAIPLWKNQVAIALTLLRQKDAVTAQRQVAQTTNDLLIKNAEMLKISSLETARENERGVVDLETLQKTQDSLITTLQETLKIQTEGRQKRQAAEIELQKMEQELKQQLLAYTQQNSTPASKHDVTPEPKQLTNK